MIRMYARWKSKLDYLLKQEKEAAFLELNARAALYRAGERRQEITALTAQADAIDKSVKEVDEKMEKGFFLCEDGYECDASGYGGDLFKPEIAAALASKSCEKCGKPMKFVRTDLMTGQEKYEAEKERKEAVAMAEQNRKAVAEHEEAIKGHEETAKQFKAQAQRTRDFADILRKL